MWRIAHVGVENLVGVHTFAMPRAPKHNNG
jgi:hypothetical protein